MSHKNLNITISTINGSGSQSSNTIIVKTLFRMGLPVSGKNFFPSNIAGLPTSFNIRVNEDGFLARQELCDVFISMNKSTLTKDIHRVKPNGTFIYNSDLKIDPILLRDDLTNVPIPFKQITKEVTTSIKLAKYMINMVYVGVLAELLKFDMTILKQTIADHFKNKASLVESNTHAIEAGQKYAQEQLAALDFPYSLKMNKTDHSKSLLIDGNTSAALGALMGGCTFMSWYPITPSSSLPEKFISYAEKYRKDAEGKNKFSVVQAEDELSAITMVIGAGWAGARSMTATSGPGMSLMAEASGLSYFAEVPAVLWNVQRAGPSTGLPTRTMQGDLLSAYNLSHGDTQHIVLLPSTPEECFEYAQTAFDLAEELQTLVIVLSDLDLGMNLWTSPSFNYPQKPFSRGKLVSKEQLEQGFEFARYKDVDQDGITYRTLPGTEHPNAAYFTRGTGHDEKSNYTEDNVTFAKKLDRLKKKHQTAKLMVPAPKIKVKDNASIGLIYYGTTASAIGEVEFLLSANHKTEVSTLNIQALPLSQKISDFIEQHKTCYVIEQNRDGQMWQIILTNFPQYAAKIRFIRMYDGLPVCADLISQQISQQESLI